MKAIQYLLHLTLINIARSYKLCMYRGKVHFSSHHMHTVGDACLEAIAKDLYLFRLFSFHTKKNTARIVSPPE